MVRVLAELEELSTVPPPVSAPTVAFCLFMSNNAPLSTSRSAVL
jgi:hypothetical protein